VVDGSEAVVAELRFAADRHHEPRDRLCTLRPALR
jgi:hypothetical protein